MLHLTSSVPVNVKGSTVLTYLLPKGPCHYCQQGYCKASADGAANNIADFHCAACGANNTEAETYGSVCKRVSPKNYCYCTQQFGGNPPPSPSPSPYPPPNPPVVPPEEASPSPSPEADVEGESELGDVKHWSGSLFESIF